MDSLAMDSKTYLMIKRQIAPLDPRCQGCIKELPPKERPVPHFKSEQKKVYKLLVEQGILPMETTFKMQVKLSTHIFHPYKIKTKLLHPRLLQTKEIVETEPVSFCY